MSALILANSSCQVPRKEVYSRHQRSDRPQHSEYPMPTPVKKVMISSTARDLPEHRQKVEEACKRLQMFQADMMEHLTAEDADALEVSLRIVDSADLYIGVFAYRYGYVPEGQSISVTEAEYDRAA